MNMKEPRYLLYCLVAIIVGCPIGALWFELAFAAKSGGDHSFELFGLLILDSFLVGWFPALLFGALLHFSMQRLGWMKLWQWTLSGAFLAWGLFFAGVQLLRIDPELLPFLLMGTTLLKAAFGQTWPAAICGAIVSTVLYCVASRFAPVATPAATS
jgi:hypothetical protein